MNNTASYVNPYINYANPIEKIKFYTTDGINVPLETKISLISQINRWVTIRKLMKIVGLEKSVLMEASIYEKSLIYGTINDLSENLISAVYIDTLQNLLSDCENPNFLKRLKDGYFDYQKIAFYDPSDIDPEGWQVYVEKEALKKHRLENMATTSAYKCRDCGGRRFTVFSLQTRSADEPTTEFITCKDCGKTFTK